MSFQTCISILKSFSPKLFQLPIFRHLGEVLTLGMCYSNTCICHKVMQFTHLWIAWLFFAHIYSRYLQLVSDPYLEVYTSATILVFDLQSLQVSFSMIGHDQWGDNENNFLQGKIDFNSYGSLFTLIYHSVPGNRCVINCNFPSHICHNQILRV